ncbi:ABC transporter ATP-binding protein [Peptoniphilus sp. AGMB00490]|uniref:ABC transporter ATP-binding protein n=1 Tax=Peptoniphilus faecalis TaxID=2731255 RepID=A0A848RBT2_9FIRM|nr:ABC transporter ATP-binding protein [Peptoniphilus faecalis]NMW84280.1 ABC transporter ATP-binding protein [Peptoniphilus faecalis]
MDLINKYTKENKIQYFISVLFAILGVISNLFVYIILSKVIVSLIDGNQDYNYYMQKIFLIFSCLLVKEIFMSLSTAISHKVAYQIIRDIRKNLMEKLFKMPLGDILNESTGKLKDIIVNQVDNTETTLAHIIPEMTANLVGPLILFIYMLVLDYRLSLISLIPLFIGGIFMSGPMKRMKVKFPQAVKIGQDMNNSIVEYINGIEVIKTFNKGEKSYKKYSENVYKKANYYYNWMRENTRDYAISMSIAPVGIFTIIPFGLYFCMKGSLDGGVFLTLIILSFGTIQNIMRVMTFEDDIGRISTIFGEIKNILNSRELYHKDDNSEIKNYNIELKNIDFSYEKDIQVINNLNINIKEGSSNALVGESGSGKSTIAKLIAGFWDVDNGSISIGNVDIKSMSLEKLSNIISYVSQDNFLFDMSIMENIRIGNRSASDKEIIEVCKKSACHDFIMNLSEGYETRVGEAGSLLSGGERQRISIARAMIKNAPIIILDEATSYIDPENEALIQDAISELVRGKTLIIIAHRLNTITNVDKIFVIKNGYLADQGSHDELLQSSEDYHNLWETALKGEKND